MSFLNWLSEKKNRFVQHLFFNKSAKLEIQEWLDYPSKTLKRSVRVDMILPADYHQNALLQYPLLVLNDGQDVAALNLLSTLEKLYVTKTIRPVIIAAIHAGNRMQEYGTAGQADYKKRGNKAAAYTNFILTELIPELEKRYRLSANKSDRVIAGFSLGGLSAFDIAWKHSDVFGKVGVFSGSLWWRSAPFRPEAPDADRIPQTMVETGTKKEGLKFWFQAGTNDEKEDRNNNGIIDAIDDTLQLIDALAALGYDRNKDIRYLEVHKGEHNPKTWGKAMSDFLKWSFNKND